MEAWVVLGVVILLLGIVGIPALGWWLYRRTR